MLKFVIFLLFIQLLSVGATHSYIETGACQEEKWQTCVYSYKAEQHFSKEDRNKNVLSMTVETTCHSVGEFNGIIATQYGMALSDVHLQGNMLKGIDIHQQQSMLANLLDGWFYFVQTEDGKVLAVYHATGEEDFAINLKKSIAAAFQANFKGSKEEKEIDPQSVHISHYSYDESDGNQIMYRHVETNDIIGSVSTASNLKKNLELRRDEVIHFRNGMLHYSAGTTDVKVKGAKHEKSLPISISDTLSSHASYDLKLDHCYAVTTIHQRRALNKKMKDNIVEANLIANFNKKSHAQNTMLEIRESIPSITKALKALCDKPSNLKLYNSMKRLLQLEYEYGTLNMYTPAIDDMLDYLTGSKVEYCQSSSAVEMIYGLLSAEGSLRSQLVLLEALKRNTVDVGPGLRVGMHISMIRNPHIELIIELEQLLDDESLRTTSLLLEFGVLGSKGIPEVEQEVTTYLQKLLASVSITSDEFSTILMAMGNTGSEYVISTILNYTDSPLEDVQLSSIRACLKFTHLHQVVDNLNEVLKAGPSEEVVTMIVHTLVKGYQYAQNMDLETNFVADHPILVSLVEAAQRLNNTDLLVIVSAYLQEIGREEVLDFLVALRDLKRRGTDWDSDKDDYNLIASLTNRQSDVEKYPEHKAHIYATSCGVDALNIKAAAGFFVGHTNDLHDVKGFVKTYAEINILSIKEPLADFEMLFQKIGTQIRGKVLVEIGGSTLVHEDQSVSTTYEYEKILGKHYHLFELPFSIYIYVGYVDLQIDVYLDLALGLNLDIAVGASLNELLTASASIVPMATMTAEASLSHDFAVAKVGVSVSANVGAKVEPQASIKLCHFPTYKASAGGLFSFIPTAAIEFDVWVQSKSVKFCKKLGFPYPCGLKWGGKVDFDVDLGFPKKWTSDGEPWSPKYETCDSVASNCKSLF